MLVQIITENGQKKVIPLTADAGAGNPVGTVIVVCSNQIPSNYLPLGTQYDTSLYPVLYALLGTDTTPTASALGLPTLTSGQYAIKATSGLSENAQDNVVAQLNEERSYSTEEVNTGKKWIDGKPIYSKVVVFSSVFDLSTTDWTIINNKLSASDLALLQSIKNIISCFINIPVNNTYMIYENLTFAIDGSNIKLQDNKGFTVQANTAMTLEYTKTT